MEENESVGHIKKVIYKLSKTNKIITLKQIIEASGVEDPAEEIEHLVKRGIIIKLSPSEFRWV